MTLVSYGTKYLETMNTKLLIPALAAGVAAFLLGWLIFGMGLMGYYEANMTHYDGLMKPEADMDLPLMFMGNLLFASLITWIASRSGASTAMGGLVTGAVVGLLVYASMDIMFLAMMNWFQNTTVIIVDILANTVWSAGIGAVAGFMLGRGAKAA